MNKSSIIAFILILFSLSVYSDEIINMNKPVSSNENIIIENPSGLINITGWDRDEISVKGKLSSHAERLDLSSNAENTILKVIVKDNKKEKKKVKSYLDIWVPVNSILDINTVSADVKIAYLNGTVNVKSITGDVESYTNAQNIDIQTASGDMEVRGNIKNLNLATVNGNVEIFGTSEYIGVEAVSSDVEIEGIYPDAKIKTVSGDIDFKSDILERGVFYVTSGDISIESKLTPKAKIDMESMSGDIKLLISGDVSADFLVGTFSGDIHIFGIPKKNRNDEYDDFNFNGKNKKMKFTSGSGDGRISAQSFSGDISIKKKL